MFLSGCIHEDTDDCMQGVRLHFSHLLNNQNINLFGERVKAVYVFVFDNNGKYVDTFISKETKLTNDYVMNLPLKPGNYQVIILGGDMSTYLFGEMKDSQNNDFSTSMKKGETDIEKFCFLIQGEENKQDEVTVNNNLSHLFHGSLNNIIVSGGKYTDATVDLIKDTKKINVNIIGYQYLDSYKTKTDYSTEVDIHINGKNGRYKKDNTIDPYAQNLKYLFGNYSLTNDTLKSTSTVMRLMIQDDPSQLRVLIPDNQYVLYDKNMIQQILLNPRYKNQSDLDREDEFTFEIKISPQLNISVKINGWDIIEITPDK